MNVFISGGCKNGKSIYAQKIARQMALNLNKPLYYLATMRPVDDEDRARIKRHLKERDGWGFETIEQSENICDCLGRNVKELESKTIDSSGVFLLDSITALLSNEMFKTNGSIDYDAPKRVGADLVEFAIATGNTVFVSDYIYSDALRYDQITESYRRGLATIDQRVAQKCDRVIEVVFGNINYIR